MFFSRKKNLDLSFLKDFVDLHSHILPKVDDGCKSTEESLYLLNKIEKLGFKKIFLSPHIKPLYSDNTEEFLLDNFQCFKQKYQGEVELQLAAEYLIDEFFLEKLHSNDLLTYNQSQYILIELAFYSPPILLENTIYEIQLKGYTPILAHPERYLYFSEEKLLSLAALGCHFQLNLLSLSDYYGKTVKKRAFSLLNKGSYRFIGTDIHHIEEIENWDNIKLSKKELTILNQLKRNNLNTFL